MLSDKVKQHFNTAAQAEWERLDINEYYRLIFRLHLDFIKEELAAKPRVLDAGSGPGRYALEFAKRGSAISRTASFCLPNRNSAKTISPPSALFKRIYVT